MDFFNTAQIASAKIQDPLEGKTKDRPLKGTFLCTEVLVFAPEDQLPLWEGIGFSADPKCKDAPLCLRAKNGHVMVLFKGIFIPTVGTSGEEYAPLTDLTAWFPVAPSPTQDADKRNNWIRMSQDTCGPIFSAFGHPLKPCEDLDNRLMPAADESADEGLPLGNDLPKVLQEMAMCVFDNEGVEVEMGAFPSLDKRTGRTKPELTRL